MVKISKHYTHHPYYTYQVHEQLVDIFSHNGIKVDQPKLKGRFKFTKRYESIGEGIVIQSTLKDKHSNYVILNIDLSKHPRFKGVNRLEDLPFEGIKDALFI